MRVATTLRSLPGKVPHGQPRGKVPHGQLFAAENLRRVSGIPYASGQKHFRPGPRTKKVSGTSTLW